MLIRRSCWKSEYVSEVSLHGVDRALAVGELLLGVSKLVDVSGVCNPECLQLTLPRNHNLLQPPDLVVLVLDLRVHEVHVLLRLLQELQHQTS